MKIIIYQDYIHNNAVLFKACAALHRTAWVDAHDIINNHALNNADQILIIPGGASRFYAEKLDSAGTHIIQNFVAVGGTYLGICAGAYYAAKIIDWQPPVGNPIQSTDTLGFFNGTACGPVNFDGLKDDRDNLPVGSINLLGELTNNTPHNVLYWAGPVFDQSTIAQDNWQVLAYYPNQQAAIISKQIGLGRVILCSPHLEYTAQDCLNRAYSEFDDCNLWQDIASQLQPSLFEKLIEQLS